ncbi:MAG TPA: Maf family protein [Stellaceae bacterium]|nr:Maf family protein [Stellaceae bacterium]
MRASSPSSPLVLASASVIRRTLLERAGITVVADPAAIDETLIKARFRRDGKAADACALALAEAKAAAVAGRHADAFILGADQILVAADRWFDKPRDLNDARAQLTALRGRPHELVSALAVWREGRLIWQVIDSARLHMREFSDDFLERYLREAGPGVLASVGAYQWEGRGAQLFERVEGDYFSILGLPLLPLLAFLRDEGVIAR